MHSCSNYDDDGTPSLTRASVLSLSEFSFLRRSPPRPPAHHLRPVAPGRPPSHGCPPPGSPTEQRTTSTPDPSHDTSDANAEATGATAAASSTTTSTVRTTEDATQRTRCAAASNAASAAASAAASEAFGTAQARNDVRRAAHGGAGWSAARTGQRTATAASTQAGFCRTPSVSTAAATSGFPPRSAQRSARSIWSANGRSSSGVHGCGASADGTYSCH